MNTDSAPRASAISTTIPVAENRNFTKPLSRVAAALCKAAIIAKGDALKKFNEAARARASFTVSMFAIEAFAALRLVISRLFKLTDALRLCSAPVAIMGQSATTPSRESFINRLMNLLQAGSGFVINTFVVAGFGSNSRCKVCSLPSYYRRTS
jgi:hypothetical protein